MVRCNILCMLSDIELTSELVFHFYTMVSENRLAKFTVSLSNLYATGNICKYREVSSALKNLQPHAVLKRCS